MISCDYVVRPIPCFTKYIVTDEGFVFGPSRNRLKTTKNDGGYLQVKLFRDDGERRWVKVHVAVLLAFVGPRPSSRHHGAHEDRDKLNNRLNNLSWKLPTENEQDKKRHGTAPKGTVPHAKRLNARQKRRIRELVMFNMCSKSELARRYGIHRKTVAKIVAGLA